MRECECVLFNFSSIIVFPWRQSNSASMKKNTNYKNKEIFFNAFLCDIQRMFIALEIRVETIYFLLTVNEQ